VVSLVYKHIQGSVILYITQGFNSHAAGAHIQFLFEVCRTGFSTALFLFIFVFVESTTKEVLEEST
jgi:hypothetical protein